MILDKFLRAPERNAVLPRRVHSSGAAGDSPLSYVAEQILNSSAGRAAIAVFPVLAMVVASPFIPVLKLHFTGFAAAIVFTAALAIAALASRIPVAWSLGLVLLLAPLEPPIRVSQSYVVGFGVDVLTVSVFTLILTDLIARGGANPSVLLKLPMPLLFLLLLATAAMLSALTAVFVHDIKLSPDEVVFVARLVKYAMIFTIGWYVAISFPSTYLRYVIILGITGFLFSGAIGFTYSLDPPGFQNWLIVTFHKAYEYDVSDPYVMTSITQRSIGTTGNPNFFGGLVGAGFLFTVGAFLSLRTGWRSTAFFAFTALLMCMNILVSQSRSAFIGVVIATTGIAALIIFHRFRSRLWLVPVNQSTAIVMIVTSFIASLVVLMAAASSPRFEDTLNQSFGRIVATVTLRSTGPADFSPYARRAQVKEYLEKWLRYPITGYGFSEGFRDGEIPRTNESEYTVMLIRTGAIGAIAYAGVFLSLLWLGWRLLANVGRIQITLGLILVALVLFNIGFAIGGPVIFEGRRMTILFAIAGLGYGLLSLIKQSDRQSNSSSESDLAHARSES